MANLVTFNEVDGYLSTNHPLFLSGIKIMAHFSRKNIHHNITYNNDKKKLLKDISEHLYNIIKNYWNIKFVNVSGIPIEQMIIVTDFEDVYMTTWTWFMIDDVEKDYLLDLFKLISDPINSYCKSLCQELSERFNLIITFHDIEDLKIEITIKM